MKQPPCNNSNNMTGTMSATKHHWMPAEEQQEEGEPSTEIKSGDLYLLTSAPPPGSASPRRRRPSRYPVHVKIYRSSFNHYAVLTASVRAPATYLNLRTCNCRPWSGSRSSCPSGSESRVELGGCEGQVMYFEVGPQEKGGELEEWVRAFQGVVVPSPGTISPSLSPVIPRNPIMPMLRESVEEEGEEEEEEEIRGLAGERKRYSYMVPKK
ncbi:hypothetical protein ACOMHN_042521 [Nucella lapillus]